MTFETTPRAALRAWNVNEETTDRALLVVSELVSNAIEHALPPIALRLGHPTPGDPLHIAVDDGGPAAREGTWTAGRAPEEHGRGRAIIARQTTAPRSGPTCDPHRRLRALRPTRPTSTSAGRRCFAESSGGHPDAHAHV
ncbi:ATP-binding protein [Kitasatospora sp. NBC_00240]|uniref:ATP-binding protein n=1 Tax=Kitasatospora sp. NBC_00240 TaxID=2903567 RepID=UPI002250D360|nr:ATP-binding protein [Kitasatospora sp. NBC_00240]MCX5208757.1 ATP-binding protein [Kitasatospora sp. NBC_00240]